MNSLLGGLGNAFMNMAKGGVAPSIQPQAAATQNMPNILMQAMGAALRGESPQDFMQRLAQQHPQLKQYDLSNLQQTAQQLCQQNNVDVQQVTDQLDQIASQIIK